MLAADSEIVVCELGGRGAGACVLCVLNTLLWYSSEEAFQYSRQKESRDWPDMSEYCLLVDMQGL